MANFDTFWARLQRKQPDLAHDSATVTISAAQLKKLLRSAYNRGCNDFGQFTADLKRGGRDTSAAENLLRSMGL